MTLEEVPLSQEAEQILLHGACGVPRHKEEWSSDCVCGLNGGSAAHDELVHRGLAYHRMHFPGGIVLTAPGLAAKAALKEGGE